MLTVPEALLARRSLGADWAAWLDGLPRLAAELLAEWRLIATGDPLHGFCGLVLPVATAGGNPAALKIAMPEEGSAGEIPALKLWSGSGAARLLRSDPRRSALLLEWLGEDLNTVEVLDACRVIGSLYPRLHRPPDPRLRPVEPLVRRELALVERLGRAMPMPPRLVTHALAVAPRLLAEDAPRAVLHGDLHFDNVLRREQEWVAIDPQGFTGDPAYEVAPVLWNRMDEPAWLTQGEAVRERLHAVVDAAGLDLGRARDWSVVRCVTNVAWAAHTGSAGQERVTRWVTVAKGLLADVV